MKPADDRCEEHGLYLYRTGFGWSCKLGCYYCDDPQKIKEGYIKQYKEELKEKVILIFKKMLDDKIITDDNFLIYNEFKCEILKLLEKD